MRTTPQGVRPGADHKALLTFAPQTFPNLLHNVKHLPELSMSAVALGQNGTEIQGCFKIALFVLATSGSATATCESVIA
jgi:hypothetical protein